MSAILLTGLFVRRRCCYLWCGTDNNNILTKPLYFNFSSSKDGLQREKPSLSMFPEVLPHGVIGAGSCVTSSCHRPWLVFVWHAPSSLWWSRAVVTMPVPHETIKSPIVEIVASFQSRKKAVCISKDNNGVIVAGWFVGLLTLYLMECLRDGILFLQTCTHSQYFVWAINLPVHTLTTLTITGDNMLA